MQPESSILVSTPSRLHFGLFSIGQLNQRKFGGLGLMIESPRTEIEVQSAPGLQIQAGQAKRERIKKAVQRWCRAFGGMVGDGRTIDLPVQVRIKSTPPEHCGLGSGTQLALAVAVGLFQHFDLPMPSATELSLAMGRAGRSAIGSYGFFQGGFLIDRGILEAAETMAPLDFWSEFDWPVLIAIPRGETGLHGTQETSAFETLPPTSVAERQALVEIVKTQLVPSLLAREFDDFASAVTEVGYRSGLFYKSIQGGAYAGPRVTEIVRSMRQLNRVAVGQSSWGPTVFGIFEDLDSAIEAQKALQHRFPDCQLHVTNADNQGARIRAGHATTSPN